MSGNKNQKIDDYLLGISKKEDKFEYNTTIANPFVKWAGGKRSITKQLLKYIPNDFNDYYEPFVGGGALFFALYNKGLIEKAYLSDINSELIITYLMIQKKPYELIELLKEHKKNHNKNSKEYYYKIRDIKQINDTIELAARFLYLNKTCYNGLYRVNKNNEFNVPIGKYKDPNIVQEDNILACHVVLQKTEISCNYFQNIKAKKYDLVYFDPPYHPIEENSFTSYIDFSFLNKEQLELRDFALVLKKSGVKVMLSNSKTDFIINNYKDEFYLKDIKAPRTVNCKSGGRESITELLMVSYDIEKQKKLG